MPDFRDVHTSYGRCLKNGRFVETFYRLLMASDAGIPGMFAGTDMPRQYMALRRGISTAISFAEGTGIVQRTVDQMAQVHSRKGRAPVLPHLHEKWLGCILQAVREHDPEITGPLVERWRLALRPVVDLFTTDY